FGVPVCSGVEIQVVENASGRRTVAGGPFSSDGGFLPLSDTAYNRPQRFARILALIAPRAFLRSQPLDGVFHERLHFEILIEIKRQEFRQYEFAVHGHRFVTLRTAN